MQGSEIVTCLRRTLLASALVATASLASAVSVQPAFAQSTYPNKVITLVVPAAAGLGATAEARLAAATSALASRVRRRQLMVSLPCFLDLDPP